MMDLGAYTQIDDLYEYVVRVYGDVPRLRGIRLMRAEEPVEADGCWQLEEYNGFCGQDVVYIHTRCGGCGDEDDPSSNYIRCGGRRFDDLNADRLIRSFDDAWDETYRDHYLRALVDDEYLALLDKMRHAGNRGGVM